jgi:uncharacterized protein (UPF0332 family)
MIKDESILFLQRAENELVSAQILFSISQNEDLQKDIFRLENVFTFYNGVISHSYYCIFYSAKALLINEDVKTSSPNIHKKTIDEFESRFVNTGFLDLELLKIYKEMVVRADELLSIFSSEKKKRGSFTYQKLPRANEFPAKESLDNAFFFFKNINKILRKN